MSATTKKGDDLAWKLLPYIGGTLGIRQTCAQICRSATTYNRIQEMWCNDEMTDEREKQVRAQEARCENRIVSLVFSLPRPDDGFWSVAFTGDPRGYTVRILAPGHVDNGYDGIGVA